MKKTACILLILLLTLGLMGQALGEGEYVINTTYYYASLDWPALGIKMQLVNPEEWTIVTAENLEEHADVICARGDTMENARLRFAYADIMFEAYNLQRIPDGVIRVQCCEDEWSRSIWSTLSGNADNNKNTLISSLTDRLNSSLFKGYLRLFGVHTGSSGLSAYLSGCVNWYPPFAYESGQFTMYCINGRYYIASYLCMTPCSRLNFMYESDMLYTYAWTWTPVGLNNIKMMQGVEEDTPVTDLFSDEDRLILNAHSGSFSLTGATERQASVRVSNGDQSWDAVVDGLSYTCQVELHPGENTLISTANKQGLGENSTQRVIPVDDAMAALELTAFPYGGVVRDDVAVKGKTSPGASLTVRIDDQEPVSVAVQADGAFSYTIPAGQVEDWVNHDIEISAHEDGLSDCTARFTFQTGFADFNQGLAAYYQTLDQNINSWDINDNPAAYTGKRAYLEVRTFTVDQRDGMLTVEGFINEDRSRPIILVYPDYMDDEVSPQMVLGVYGEFLDPALTNPPVPRMAVEYTRNSIYDYYWNWD